MDFISTLQDENGRVTVEDTVSLIDVSWILLKNPNLKNSNPKNSNLKNSNLKNSNLKNSNIENSNLKSSIEGTINFAREISEKFISIK